MFTAMLKLDNTQDASRIERVREVSSHLSPVTSSLRHSLAVLGICQQHLSPPSTAPEPVMDPSRR